MKAGYLGTPRAITVGQLPLVETGAAQVPRRGTCGDGEGNPRPHSTQRRRPFVSPGVDCVCFLRDLSSRIDCETK